MPGRKDLQRKEDDANPPAEPRRGGRQGYSETVGEGEGSTEPIPEEMGPEKPARERGLDVAEKRAHDEEP